ncbi:MAG: hypothetical protein ACNFW9_05275 [Candidatus Kerfeldbacteria bacterium]
MKKIFPLLYYIVKHELVLVALIILIVPTICLAVSDSVNVSVTVAPPQAPEITIITAYSDQHAISIQGKTIYKDQIIYLVDNLIGETLELQTDDQGNFIAIVDDSSRFVQIGQHQIVVLIEINQEECNHLEGEKILYYVNQDYQVTVDISNDQNVELLIDDISKKELEDLQRAHPNRDTSTTLIDNICNIAELGFGQENQRLTVWQWVVIVFSSLVIMMLLVKRWIRKKRQGKSFWSLDVGTYLYNKQNK